MPDADPEHLERLSRVYGPATWDVYEKLDRSLEPRGPDWLLERARDFLRPGQLVLDAGCRDGAHLVRLVQENDCRGVGVEPVAIHVERAWAAVEAAGLQQRIDIVHGTMDEFGYAPESFDFVWCRDVLEQVDPLGPALAGVRRVMRPGAAMLVFTVVTTPQLRVDERELLRASMGNVEKNLDEHYLLSAFEDAGLVVESRDEIGTEWREFAEERTQPVSQSLLRLARLRRQQESILAEHGMDIYTHIEANLHWELFQFLGKLLPVVYVLRRA